MKKALLLSACLALTACGGQMSQRDQMYGGGGALIGGLIGYQFGGGWGSFAIEAVRQTAMDIAFIWPICRTMALSRNLSQHVVHTGLDSNRQ